MARPFKDSLDYFPLDVDFLEDKKVKLLKAEFGVRSILVLIALFSLIYKSNGYFYKWDDDDCFLMSDGIGCGCKPEFIQEVLQGCIRRSVFDGGVFDMFHVLTSRGIQRRYMNAVSERKNITIIKEYWLIDISDTKVFTDSILKKLTINSINQPINSINPPINLIKPPINTQSKVKESKVNKNKDINGTSPSIHKFNPPTIEEVKAYCSERNNCVDAEKWFDFYAAKGWMIGKNKMKDWQAAVRTWEKNTVGQAVKATNLSNRNNFEERNYGDEYYDGFFSNVK